MYLVDHIRASLRLVYPSRNWEQNQRGKKLVGQELKGVKQDCEDLILEFTGVTVRISAQYSDAYGSNMFWDFEKKRKSK